MDKINQIESSIVAVTRSLVKELSVICSAIEVAAIESVAAKSKLASLVVEKSTIEKGIEERLSSVRSKENALEQREQELNEKLSKSSTRLSEQENKFQSLVVASGRLEEKIEDQKSKNNSYSQAKELYDSVMSDLAEANKKLLESSEKRSLEEKFSDELKYQVLDAQNLLARTLEEIEVAKRKVVSESSDIISNLEQREKNIKKRESDVEVVIKRIRSKAQEIGVDFKI